MNAQILTGTLIPFIGTAGGAAMVYLMRGQLKENTTKALQGFAAGVMVSASFFSLLIPSIEQSESMGKLSFIPAVVGFLLGVAFLLILDEIIPHLHMNSDVPEGRKTNLKKTTMMVLAVTLHNIPEGMSVGAVYAGWLYGSGSITASAALVMAIGIAIQNFPEGAIISMPLYAQGESKTRAFASGALSGAVEPIGTIVTIMLAGLIVPFLPYLLSFAAGAMMYVVVEELVPEMSAGEHSNVSTVMFAIGMAVMLALDVGLG